VPDEALRWRKLWDADQDVCGDSVLPRGGVALDVEAAGVTEGELYHSLLDAWPFKEGEAYVLKDAEDS
jgi:hypothetical protein